MLITLLFIFISSALGVPHIVIKPGTNPVQQPAGQQLNVLCSVEGASDESRPGIIWNKHGGLDKTGNAQVNRLDPNTLALVIHNTTVADSGVYTCKAAIEEITMTKSIDVIFFDDLKFVDETTHVDDLMPTASVNVSCEVDVAHLRDTITTWSRNEKLVPAGSKYKFYKNSSLMEIINYDPAQDAGDYLCRVMHLVTGSTVTRTITIGGVHDKRRTFCNNMCHSLCTNMYTNFKP